MCRWRATYRLKALNEGYNFVSYLTSIGGIYIKLWTSKVAGVLILGISELSHGSPRTKWHLGVGPMARHRVYYKGEGGGFPWVRAVVSFVNPCLPMVRPCTKRCSNSTLTNLLFDLCRSAWIIELFVTHPSPIPELQHAPLPPKCYKLGSMPQLILLLLLSPLDLHLSPSRSLGVRH
jgi:hypothetical protein